jgi:cytochrome c oxidase assembly protein subunit 17
MGNEQTKPAAAPVEPVEPKKAPVLGKSGKKICCSCPETKEPRDLCVVTKGEANCRDLIEAHNKCLRAEGFIINDK